MTLTSCMKSGPHFTAPRTRRNTIVHLDIPGYTARSKCLVMFSLRYLQHQRFVEDIALLSLTMFPQYFNAFSQLKTLYDVIKREFKWFKLSFLKDIWLLTFESSISINRKPILPKISINLFPIICMRCRVISINEERVHKNYDAD